MQASYNENDISALLQKLRIFNKNIGTYQKFGITENFDYVIKLSNGKILLKLEELQDDEKDVLTPELLVIIANRFIPSDSQTTSDELTDKNEKGLNFERSNKKKIRNLLLIGGIFLGVIVIGLLFFQQFFNDTDFGRRESYIDKVRSVEEIERSEPTEFLIADGTYNENFWGDKLKIDCEITNIATVASYKDAVIRITYYTKTNTEIGSEDLTIYETFPPNSTIKVKLKVNKYEDVHHIGWEVISAKPN